MTEKERLLALLRCVVLIKEPKTCGTCEHFHRQAPGDTMGSCRRYALRAADMGKWPVLLDESERSCGEFKECLEVRQPTATVSWEWGGDPPYRCTGSTSTLIDSQSVSGIGRE